MLSCITLKISPKLIGKRVSGINIVLQNIFHYLFFCQRMHVEFKLHVSVSLTIKPYNDDSFTMLRHITLSIKNSIRYRVIKLF